MNGTNCSITSMETPLELQPKFTEQDDMRDLASLTVQDLVKLQADLTGMQHGLGAVTTSLSSSTDARATTTALVPSDHILLGALDNEIAKLPASTTMVYRQALVQCPGEVNAMRRKRFLICEDGDPVAAATRMTNYWNFRMDLFGPDKCFLPMTLTGAMADEMIPMAERRVFQLLPCADKAGRAIFLFQLCNRDLTEYSVERENMTLFYLFESIFTSNACSGHVVLVDARNITGQHHSKKTQKYTPLIDSVFPSRLRALHICYPSSFMYYVVHPIVKYLLPKQIRLRIKLHHGAVQKVLGSLRTYNLPPECVPVELGGALAIDMNEFLMDNMRKEADALGLHVQPVDNGHNDHEQDDSHREKRQHSTCIGHGRMATSSTSPPAMAELSLADSVYAKTSVHFKSQSTGGTSTSKVDGADISAVPRGQKRKGPRNVVDPRMAIAVKERQRYPKMKLYDALVAGGFVFRHDPERNEMVDQDGTTLVQVSTYLHFIQCIYIKYVWLHNAHSCD